MPVTPRPALTARSLTRALTSIVVVLLAVGVLALAPQRASAAGASDPAGTYYYQCIHGTGQSYFLRPGERLNTCKGSYLQKFIHGNLVSSTPWTSAGTPADPQGMAKLTAGLGCVVAVVANGVIVLTTKGKGVKAANGAAATLDVLSWCRA